MILKPIRQDFLIGCLESTIFCVACNGKGVCTYRLKSLLTENVVLCLILVVVLICHSQRQSMACSKILNIIAVGQTYVLQNNRFNYPDVSFHVMNKQKGTVCGPRSVGKALDTIVF
jgi:hypothetical protein